MFSLAIHQAKAQQINARIPQLSHVRWAEERKDITHRTKVTEDWNPVVFATTHYAELKSQGIQLVQQYHKKSKIGSHYNFIQTFQGKPIWGAYIKMDVLNEGSVIIKNHLVNVSGLSIEQHQESTHWLVVNQNLIPVKVRKTNGYEILEDMQGAAIRHRDTRLFLHNEDTMVNGKVFAPDPLSSAGVIYGTDNEWVLYKDSDIAIMNNQRINVTFPVTYENDSFVLKNAYVRMVDIDPPLTGITKSKTPNFEFLRSTQKFKDVNAFYHIYNTQMYLQQLGYNIVQYPIKVDAGKGYADNSYFTYDPDTTLNFGLGGVPDAEDADVIVHEYTHAISYDINPTPNMGTERRTLDEAFGDVIAARYSKKYSDFNWRRLFNYDGPNPVSTGFIAYWPGRNGSSTKTYTDRTGDIYRDSEIWTSCMLDIGEEIGLDTMVDIMLSSISLMTAATTMPEAAQMMLTTDSLLYEGKHMLTMGIYFNERKFGDFPVGLNTLVQASDSPFDIFNTIGFANGNSSAFIEFNNNDNYSIEMVNMLGKQILKQENIKHQFEISPMGLDAGLYFLKITVGNKHWTHKLIKSVNE